MHVILNQYMKQIQEQLDAEKALVQHCLFMVDVALVGQFLAKPWQRLWIWKPFRHQIQPEYGERSFCNKHKKEMMTEETDIAYRGVCVCVCERVCVCVSVHSCASIVVFVCVWVALPADVFARRVCLGELIMSKLFSGWRAKRKRQKVRYLDWWAL